MKNTFLEVPVTTSDAATSIHIKTFQKHDFNIGKDASEIPAPKAHPG